MEDELSKPDLKRADLFSLYERAITERFAPRSVIFEAPDRLQVETADGRTINVFMENLWIQCRNSSEDKRDIFERYLKGLVPVMQPESNTPLVGKENVIPIIKDNEYLAVCGKKGSVNEHLAGDIWIVYAVDLPNATQSLTESKMQELGITRDELDALALRNLRRILPEIQQHGEGPWFMLTAGGDYTASLLLLDDLWSQVQESVEGDIVAAVPARDVVLFTGSCSKEGIEAVRRKSHEIHTGGDHVVSETLLRLSSGKWIVFD